MKGAVLREIAQAIASAAKTAARLGPFEGFADNEEHMLRVLTMHRDASYQIDDDDVVPDELLSAGQRAWENAVRDGREHGVRLLFADDGFDKWGRDGFDIGGICELGIRHDRRRVRVDEDHPIPVGLECLDCLGP